MIEPTAVDAALAARGMALIEVRSVYDTDGLNRMGENMLAAVDLPAGCAVGIAKRTPLDAMDTRGEIADLVRMKDPADAAYGCSPARFVRATRAVSPPSNAMGGREAIGETEFEQQQILGYAPVEPDGSFKLIVPADVPLALLGRSTPRAAASRPTSTGSRCGRASAAPATAATARAAARRSTPAPSSTPCRRRSCRRSAARTSRARRWRRCAPGSTRPRST